MFREIANGIRGRKKTVDEKLTYDSLSDFLLGMGGNPVREARLNYFGYDVDRTTHVEDFKPATMNDAMAFIRKELAPSAQTYTYIKHQAFSGKGGIKHYIDVASGPVSGEDVPYREVSIEFVMNHDGLGRKQRR